MNSKNYILNIFPLFFSVYRSCNDKSVTLENFTLFVNTFLTENNATNRIVMLRCSYLNLSVFGEVINNYRTENTRSIRHSYVHDFYCNVFRTIGPSDRWSLEYSYYRFQ